MEIVISYVYTIPIMTALRSSTGSKARQRLSLVLRATGDLISVGSVSEALSISRTDAAKLLARWNTQGWIKRLSRGHYVPVPLAALGQEQVLEDPWIMVPELFGPAYIGGWSAAEHWGLTEQIFRSTCVITTRKVRQKDLVIQGLPFTLKHVRTNALFETRPVWRGRARIMVSSPAKTIIDMLDDPALGGGIRHVADCLSAYLARKDAAPDELIQVAIKLGNGAVFKRLGFLAEQREIPAIAAKCRDHLSQGNSKLDPAIPSRKLVKRWRLWIPVSWGRAKRS